MHCAKTPSLKNQKSEKERGGGEGEAKKSGIHQASMRHSPHRPIGDILYSHDGKVKEGSVLK